MDDKTTTIKKIKDRVIKFRDKRNWSEYNTIDNLLMSVIIEIGELMEHFRWRTQKQSKEYMKDKKSFDEVRFEFADVMVYLFTLANDLGIDISQAIDEKLDRQDKKYPVEKMLKWQKMSDREKWEDYKEIKEKYR